MTESVLYGGTSTARVRVHHLQQAKERGEKWAMLTAYDTFSASVFEEAGIPVMLVGDSAGNVVLGHTSTVPVTVEDILVMTKAVTRSTKRALIVADLPFGSYEASPQQAFATVARRRSSSRAGCGSPRRPGC
jgi:3-methyl-2-oxobutanoate hydroxymethyltransferase